MDTWFYCNGSLLHCFEEISLIMEREEVQEILKFCVWLRFFAAIEVFFTEDILFNCCKGGSPGVFGLVTCFYCNGSFST